MQIVTINRWFLNSAAPLSCRQFPILLLQFPYRCFVTLITNNKMNKKEGGRPSHTGIPRGSSDSHQESNPACTLQYRVPTRYTMQVRDGIYNFFDLLVSEQRSQSCDK